MNNQPERKSDIPELIELICSEVKAGIDSAKQNGMTVGYPYNIEFDMEIGRCGTRIKMIVPFMHPPCS